MTSGMQQREKYDFACEYIAFKTHPQRPAEKKTFANESHGDYHKK